MEKKILFHSSVFTQSPKTDFFFVFLSSSISPNHLLNVSTPWSELTCDKIHWLDELESLTCLYKVSHMNMHIRSKEVPPVLTDRIVWIHKSGEYPRFSKLLLFPRAEEQNKWFNCDETLFPYEKVPEGQPSLQLYQSEFVSEGADRRTTTQELPAWETRFSGLTNLKLSGLNSKHYVWRKPLSTEPDCLRQCNDCFFYLCGLSLVFLDCLVSGYY